MKSWNEKLEVVLVWKRILFKTFLSLRSVMSVIDFVAIMPYYIGLTMSDDNEVGSDEHHHHQLYYHPSSRRHHHHHHNDHHHSHKCGGNSLLSFPPKYIPPPILPPFRPVSPCFVCNIINLVFLISLSSQFIDDEPKLPKTITQIHKYKFNHPGFWGLCHPQSVPGVSHFQILSPFPGLSKQQCLL